MAMVCISAGAAAAEGVAVDFVDYVYEAGGGVDEAGRVYGAALSVGGEDG